MKITELLPKLTEEDKKYLQENLKSQKDFYDYFVTKGLTDSFEEFTDFAKKMEKFSDTELSDDDLEKIAGGDVNDIFYENYCQIAAANGLTPMSYEEYVSIIHLPTPPGCMC